MVSSFLFLMSFPLFFLASFSISLNLNPILPKAAVIPVTKDISALQYVASVFWGKNRDPLRLVLDLNGPSVWFHCGTRSGLNSYLPIEKCSLKCSMATGSRGFFSKTCGLTAVNTVSGVSDKVEVNEDEIALRIWDGFYSMAKIEQFLFSCVPNSMLQGLARGAKGMLGLGDSRASLPSQLFSQLGLLERRFSLCLSPTKGTIFLVGSPSEIETSTSIMYTPLISQNGYYINVGSIKISGKKLSIPIKGFLGMKLNTLIPYTTMESKLYSSFIRAYVNAAVSLNMTVVSPVAPFKMCFSSIGGRTVSPVIDLVLQSEMVKWRIGERNSLVHVSDEVMCLGVLDGGLDSKDEIVLGVFQMEDHLLEFNLGNSMLGLASMGHTKCSDFEHYNAADA